jgi:hypothetical protein
MHQPGDKFIFLGLLVVMDTLNKRRGAITHPDYGYIYLTQVLVYLPSIISEERHLKSEKQTANPTPAPPGTKRRRFVEPGNLFKPPKLMPPF